ncbi:outer membrane protein P1 [Haemophilus influenzae]|uniref:Outer membrane protein P1 n=1 Tax=Haemophilus influenzae (strain ATCC 51907 / DSM 11121 / KW20 / Rd) TaxID=71421 RepID=OPP11_HAEIN|nr:OmpP1/FadL family transporter [Haemophilus influenzae]P43838.1 RecName: Full=Outer membrane protein P1; Short=OMP P1; Flags: Precursor [Haemophilus influenzae Rd KW20]AAC22060.1 long-chain fatty acid transport protein (fadL) [Haemophilus influenzae Rd KW20]ARB90485.1 outer membrane protein P1 [Haemophilus influenzae]EEW76813.1 outer membrane protein P1 [Haemophilus influenzae RdAW]MCK9045750.1 OmpP1/FadL family transporter [Haemophilus influenzae]
MKKFNQSLLATAMLLAAGGANAAAFQLAEVSTSGLGRAYAGEAAIADNASVVATNPALMSLFKTAQFSTGGVYVDSRINMNGDVTSHATIITSSSGIKAIEGGSASARNVVPGAFVPNLYFVAPVNDKFALGAGMNVNFGLKSEYDDSYDAGIFGGKTDLSAINLNLSGAYRVTEGLSLGLGVNAVYAKAQVERNAGIIADSVKDNQVKTALTVQQEPLKFLDKYLPSKDTSVVSLQDRAAWGFGWNAGVMYQFNEANRIGLAYHSKVDIDFTDRTATSVEANVIKAGKKGDLTLTLPDYLELSGFHQLTDKLAVHYSYKYTHWSRLTKLNASFEDGKKAFDKELQYSNNSRVALGASYNLDEKLTLRAGIAYDQAASRHQRSAAIPDTDRTWYSLGATYKFTPNLSVDLGYAYLKGKKVHFKEVKTIGDERSLTLNTTANYTSQAHANLYGLNLNYSF